MAVGLDLPPGAAYFPTPCRIDGLASGGLVAALMRSERARPFLYYYANRIGAIALLLLAGLFVWRSGLRFTDPACLTAGLTLLAVLASCTIIVSIESGPDNPLRRGLESRWLRFLGKYSYGIYVLHHLSLPPLSAWFPLRMLAEKTHSEILGLLVHVAIVLIVSVASVIASWHLFETHFLKLKNMFDYTSPRKTATVIAPACVRDVPARESL